MHTGVMAVNVWVHAEARVGADSREPVFNPSSHPVSSIPRHAVPHA